jgi:hypothetical protein
MKILALFVFCIALIAFNSLAESGIGELEDYTKKCIQGKMSASQVITFSDKLLMQKKITRAEQVQAIKGLSYQKRLSQKDSDDYLSKVFSEKKTEFDFEANQQKQIFESAKQATSEIPLEKQKEYLEMLQGYQKEANERLNILDQLINKSAETQDTNQRYDIYQEVDVKLREIKAFGQTASKILTKKSDILSGKTPPDAPIPKKDFLGTDK